MKTNKLNRCGFREGRVIRLLHLVKLSGWHQLRACSYYRPADWRILTWGMVPPPAPSWKS